MQLFQQCLFNNISFPHGSEVLLINKSLGTEPRYSVICDTQHGPSLREASSESPRQGWGGVHKTMTFLERHPSAGGECGGEWACVSDASPGRVCVRLHSWGHPHSGRMCVGKRGPGVVEWMCVRVCQMLCAGGSACQQVCACL